MAPLKLVTGGAGFIGSHLVEALLARGHRVRVLDDFSTGRLENLEEVEDQIDLVRGTLLDLATVHKATAGADYVFHLAAPPPGEPSLADPLRTHHCGATGTLHLLLAARQANVKRVVYASSSCVYGVANDLPRREDELPLPLSPSGVAKLNGEQHCVAFTGVHGLETVRLRYFNVFGPRQPAGNTYSGEIGQLITQMLARRRPRVTGGLLRQQDLIYVDDVVHATLLSATAPRAAGRVYNIARGRPTTPLELITVLNTILGTRIEALDAVSKAPMQLHNLADTFASTDQHHFSRWWVGNVATNVKPSAARIAEERRNVGAERQVRLPVEVAALSATLPTH
ncbi:MAG TPA: NAD-dependent epimerase/dehydratase family protein, partial [Gemmataceae bacterium]|nr:NAD-dependent epimerase/dehydratase family protein [Gemmataceae bacterium]